MHSNSSFPEKSKYGSWFFAKLIWKIPAKLSENKIVVEGTKTGRTYSWLENVLYGCVSYVSVQMQETVVFL